MTQSISSTILNIANISKQSDKQDLFNALDPELRKLIEGSLSGELKFGITKFNYDGANCSNNVSATEEQLVTCIKLILCAKGNLKKLYLARFYEMYDADSFELIVKVVTGKLKIGLGAKLTGAEKFTVQLASEYNQKKHDTWAVYYSEEKLDGMRLIIFINGDGTAEARTRGGKLVNTVDHILQELIQVTHYSLPNTPVVYDGEIAADTFAETIHLVKRKEAVADSTVLAKFHAFDMLLGVTKDDYMQSKFGDTPLQLRKRLLTQHLITDNVVGLQNVVVVKYNIFNNITDVINQACEFIESGKEGVIAKHPHALYEAKRAPTWFKIKDILSKDLVIVGVKIGTGKYEGKLGAIIVSHNGVQVSVGGGFTDQERFDLWEQPDLLIGRIAEIEYHQETPDGSLRHPRFKCFRDYFEKGVKE